MPGGSPYITASTLLARPASISWQVIPTLTASGPEQAAQIQQACWNATSTVDAYLHQPLRSTISTETLHGPGAPRVAVSRRTGIATLVMRQHPVTDILAVQVSPAWSFPPQWTLIPPGQYRARHPVITSAGPAPATGPSGGAVIDVAPGFLSWDCPQEILVSYAAGYPHSGLAAQAESGAASVSADDVTGWGDGWTAFIYDGAATEAAQVTAAAADSPVPLPGLAPEAQAGPGTLTLAAPLAYPHAPGTVISAIPADAIRAAVLAATVEALEGIDAIATQSLSGAMAGGTGVLAQQYELILDSYKRVA